MDFTKHIILISRVEFVGCDVVYEDVVMEDVRTEPARQLVRLLVLLLMLLLGEMGKLFHRVRMRRGDNKDTWEKLRKTNDSKSLNILINYMDMWTSTWV